MEISVVIPAYNESDTIRDTIERVHKVLSKYRKEFEIIVIDDGSRDSTWKKLIIAKKKFKNLVLLRNMPNAGKTVSLNKGFGSVKGSVVVMMDADLQQIPEDIPLLLEKIERGHDVVNGWRKERKDPKYKLVMSKIYNLLSRLMFGTKIHDMNCGFKAIRKEVLDKIILRPGFFRYIPVLAKMEGFGVSEVRIRHFKREHGKSKYGFGRVLVGVDLLSIKLKSMFAKRPMILFGSVGGVGLFLGLISGLYLSYLKLVLNEPIGTHLPLLFFTTISLLGGIVMISFGFLADMIKDLEYRIERKKARD